MFRCCSVPTPVFIDLDRFKNINDSLGHAAGDLILKVVGMRLREALRTDDFVARVGGDEFVVLLRKVGSPADRDHVVDKVSAVFSEHIAIEGIDILVSASMGTAVYPVDADSKDLLLRNSDMAMYHAKAPGRNRVSHYDRTMSETVTTFVLKMLQACFI